MALCFVTIRDPASHLAGWADWFDADDAERAVLSLNEFCRARHKGAAPPPKWFFLTAHYSMANAAMRVRFL